MIPDTRMDTPALVRGFGPAGARDIIFKSLILMVLAILSLHPDESLGRSPRSNFAAIPLVPERNRVAQPYESTEKAHWLMLR